MGGGGGRTRTGGTVSRGRARCSRRSPALCRRSRVARLPPRVQRARDATCPSARGLGVGGDRGNGPGSHQDVHDVPGSVEHFHPAHGTGKQRTGAGAQRLSPGNKRWGTESTVCGRFPEAAGHRSCRGAFPPPRRRHARSFPRSLTRALGIKKEGGKPFARWRRGRSPALLGSDRCFQAQADFGPCAHPAGEAAGHGSPVLLVRGGGGPAGTGGRALSPGAKWRPGPRTRTRHQPVATAGAADHRARRDVEVGALRHRMWKWGKEEHVGASGAGVACFGVFTSVKNTPLRRPRELPQLGDLLSQEPPSGPQAPRRLRAPGRGKPLRPPEWGWGRRRVLRSRQAVFRMGTPLRLQPRLGGPQNSGHRGAREVPPTVDKRPSAEAWAGVSARGTRGLLCWPGPSLMPNTPSEERAQRGWL